MIIVKSILAGMAALIMAALIIYALAVGVPRLLELIPRREGGVGVYMVGPYPMWPVAVGALIVFCGGFYWNFRRARRHALRRFRGV
jgi:hypothetical protein